MNGLLINSHKQTTTNHKCDAYWDSNCKKGSRAKKVGNNFTKSLNKVSVLSSPP